MPSLDQDDQEYQIHTATAIRLRKVVSPVRQPCSESPHMARDHQRVTSTMPPPFSPYDCTTPPLTPISYTGTTPRPPFYAQTPGYTRRADAAAVWQHGSQTAQTVPRGYGPRDGVDYNRARDAQFSALHPIPYTLSPYLQAYAASRIPKMHAQQHPLPRIMIPTHPSEMVATRLPGELQVLDGTKDIAKKTKTKTKSKSVSKTPDWLAGLTQKKRRPSDMFNKNFGFDVASLRAPSDRTPQISPRTSISQDIPPSPLSPADSVKRQRVDSKSAEMLLGFPFGKPTPTESMRGRDLGSPAMSPRNSIELATPPTSRHGTMSSLDVHPGTPVDWSSSSSVADADSSSPGPNTYYAPVAPEGRRRSFPSISLPAERKQSKEDAMLARLAALETTATGRKRACTLERRDRTSRKVAPTSGPTSATSTKSMMHERGLGAVPPLKRATSDPSTEAFLKHVRASLEKRRSKDGRDRGKDGVVDYLVFADEGEKGFLDDAPL